MKKYKYKFRDYSKYPPEIMDACHFRDANDDEPDGAFWAIASEQGLYDALLDMADWEVENTNWKPNKHSEGKLHPKKEVNLRRIQ